MKKIIYLITVILLTYSCKKKIYIDPIFKKRAAEIEKHINHYQNYYHLKKNKYTIRPEIFQSNKVAGGTSRSRARADIFGNIFLDPTQSYSRSGLRNTLIHEIFHTLPKKTDTLWFKTPILLKSKSTQKIDFLGTVNLKLIGRIDKGQIGTLCSLIDEGSAEFCALKCTPKYEVSSPKYFIAGSVLKKLAKNNPKLTPKAIINIQKNGTGLPALCSLIIRRKATDKDVVKLGLIFMSITHKDIENIDKIIEDIVKI